MMCYRIPTGSLCSFLQYGHIFELSHHVLPAGFVFVTSKAKAVREDVPHEYDFLCVGEIFLLMKIGAFFDSMDQADMARQNWM